MEKSKVITNILNLLDKATENNFRLIVTTASAMVGTSSKNVDAIFEAATEKQLRLIYLVAYEIVRKPSEK